MKFGEIPRFTKRPSYHVNVDLSYLEKWLNDQETELSLQIEPDFQRGHVWNGHQQIAYIEYLLRGGSSGKDFYFNRIGGMHDLRNLKAEFVLVDGLQRITACLRFLHDEIQAFGTWCSDFEEKNLRFADVTFSIYINDLSTKKDVLIWYLEMNSGGTPHTTAELKKVKEMIKHEM